MRIAALCTDCGFENPRTWVTCARCGCLLGPRLRRVTETNAGQDSQITGTTLRASLPVPEAARAPKEPEPEGETGIYSAPKPPAPEAPTAPSPPPDTSAPAAAVEVAAASGGDAVKVAAVVMTAGSTPSTTPASARPAPPSDARPLLGQAAAIAAVEAALDAGFDGGRAALLALQGEPGSGRTLLLHRASELAAVRRPNVAVHYAALRSRDDGPYAPFSRLLLDRFGITPASSPVAVRSAMEQAVGDVLGAHAARVADTTHLLGHTAGVPFPDSALLRELDNDPAGLREQAVAAVARFFAGEAARCPMLLLLDDLAEADDGAFDVLAALLELDAQLVLIATGRAQLIERIAALQARSSERVRSAELVPLTQEAAAQLVRTMVPDLQELPEELLSALMHRSGGNPRQLVELLRALQDGGLFQRGEDGFTFVDLLRLERGGLPLTMADTIRARLATLDAAELQVMHDAAVVGERFWDGALVALSRARGQAPEAELPSLQVFTRDEDQRALAAALDTLEAKGFIVLITDPGALGLREYTFEFAGTRSLIYADLPESGRNQGHALVARWLSLTPALAVESLATLLAPHLEHGGSREQAARAYLQAAADERTRMRTTMALRYVDKTLALTDARDTALRIEALHERGSILTTLGRYEEALAAFDEIVKLAWALGACGRGGAALNRIARIHRERAEHDKALEHLQMALSLFQAVGDQRGVASSYDDMAQIHRMRGELPAAFTAAKEALQIRVQTHDRRGQAVSLNTMGRIELDQGMFDSAHARFVTALRIREALADHEGAVQTRLALGQLAFRRGRVDEAIRTYAGALEVAREMNNRRFQSYALGFLGEAYVAQNDLERADTSLREAKRLANAIRDQNALATIERTLAQLAQRRSPA